MTQFKYTVWHYVSDFHNFVISISTCPRTGIQLFVTSGAACLKWTILLEYIVEAFFNAVTFFQQRFQLKLKPTKLLIESRQYPHLNIYCMWITVVTEHKHKKNTCLIEPFPDDNFKKYDTKHIPIWSTSKTRSVPCCIYRSVLVDISTIDCSGRISWTSC
jgi:hypothetical protein